MRVKNDHQTYTILLITITIIVKKENLFLLQSSLPLKATEMPMSSF